MIYSYIFLNLLTPGAYKICLYFIQKMFFVAEIQTFDALPTHAGDHFKCKICLQNCK